MFSVKVIHWDRIHFITRYATSNVLGFTGAVWYETVVQRLKKKKLHF
jgi:hypothetical protein